MRKKAICIILTMVMIFSACTARTGVEDEKSAQNNANKQSEEHIKDILLDDKSKVISAMEQNEDTVAWVTVPNTYVDDVVVQGEDNKFYMRKDFDKNYSLEGIYFADHRAKFGEGNQSELSLNTVIYGHAMTDNPESENYDIKFSSLHNFRDEKFARENPYIFMSTQNGNYAYEIFAVFIANSDNVDLPYNNPNLEPKQFLDMVEKEVLPRSIWNYGKAKLTEEDKFITLSTCIYVLEDGTETGYPNTWYRMGIMGKLIDPASQVKTELNIEKNKNVIVDKDTYPK